MGIFKKLFGKNTDNIENEENKTLLRLIGEYYKWASFNAYLIVLHELQLGSSFLYLPSINDGEEGMKNISAGDILKLTCVHDVNGVRIMGAFTSKNALSKWAKNGSGYTKIEAKIVVNEICPQMGVECLIIDDGLPTKFVLKREEKGTKTITIKENTKVQIGRPLISIGDETIEKLIPFLKEIPAIKEAYQYGQTLDNEFNIVLGFIISPHDAITRDLVISSVDKALREIKIGSTLFLFILNESNLYEVVKAVDNSLFYTNIS